MKAFPKELSVRYENEGTDDEFFLVEPTPEDFAHPQSKVTAAVYRLDRVVVVESKTTVIVRKRR